MKNCYQIRLKEIVHGIPVRAQQILTVLKKRGVQPEKTEKIQYYREIPVLGSLGFSWTFLLKDILKKVLKVFLHTAL